MSDTAGGHPREQLSPYLDDELPFEERAAIDRHLALCPDCREELDALRRLSRAVASEPVPSLPVDLEDRVLRRIDAASVAPLRRRRLVVPASIAATIAAVGLVAVVAWKSGGVNLLPNPARERGDSPETFDRGRSMADKKEPAPKPAAPPPAPAEALVLKEAERGKAAELKRDDVALQRAAQNAVTPDQDAAEPAGGVPGGVVGGVVGGVEENAPVLAKSKDETAADAIGPGQKMTRVASLPPASRSATGAPLVACPEPVVDSGTTGDWEVADVAVARRELDALAVAHGGRLDIQGAEPSVGIAVVLPHASYPAFAAAAQRLGVAGLDASHVAEGSGCVRQPITLRLAQPR